MKKPGRMILLTVRTNDLRKSPPKEGEFDRAWFRLVNEKYAKGVPSFAEIL